MYWLLPLTIAFASLNSVVLHKTKLGESRSIYLYNLLCSAVWFVCLFTVNGFRLTLSEDAIIWGALYGITQALFILFKTAAMNSGPVSVTTLLGNSSLVISVIVCFFLWDEPISLPDVGGLICLMTGLFFVTYKKEKRTLTKKWTVYTILLLLCATGVGIIFKAFSKTGSSESTGDMMLISAIVMLLSYTPICLFTGGFKKGALGNAKSERLTFASFALISGFLSCIYNRLNIYLSGVINAVIFFPVFNGRVIVLSTILGVIMLREKLRPKQLLGFLMGILGICIISIF